MPAAPANHPRFQLLLILGLILLDGSHAVSPVVYRQLSLEPKLLAANQHSLIIASHDGLFTLLNTSNVQPVVTLRRSSHAYRTMWLGSSAAAFQDGSGHYWLQNLTSSTSSSPCPILRGLGRATSTRCSNNNQSTSLELLQHLEAPRHGATATPKDRWSNNLPQVTALQQQNLLTYEMQGSGLLQPVSSNNVGSLIISKQHLVHSTRLYILTADSPARLVVMQLQGQSYSLLPEQVAVPAGVQAMTVFSGRFLLLGNAWIDLDGNGSTIQLPTPPLASLELALEDSLPYTVAYAPGVKGGLHVLRLQARPFTILVTQSLLGTAVVRSVVAGIFHVFAIVAYGDQSDVWLMTYNRRADGSLEPRAAFGVVLENISSAAPMRLQQCATLLHVVLLDRIWTFRKADNGSLTGATMHHLPPGLALGEVTMAVDDCSLFASTTNGSLLVLRPACQSTPYAMQPADWNAVKPESQLFGGPNGTVWTRADDHIRTIGSSSPSSSPDMSLRLPAGLQPRSIWIAQDPFTAFVASNTSLRVYAEIRWYLLDTPAAPFAVTLTKTSDDRKICVVGSSTQLWGYSTLALSSPYRLTLPASSTCPDRGAPLHLLPTLSGAIMVRNAACDPLRIWRFNLSAGETWAVRVEAGGLISTTMAAVTTVQAAAVNLQGDTLYLVARAATTASWRLYVHRFYPYTMLTMIESALPLAAVRGLAVGYGMAAVAWDTSIALVEVARLTSSAVTLVGAQLYNLTVPSTQQVLLRDDLLLLHLSERSQITAFPLRLKVRFCPASTLTFTLRPASFDLTLMCSLLRPWP